MTEDHGRLSRRTALRCMAYGGAGTLFALSGGILAPIDLAVAAENKMRDEADTLNVNMLGYASCWEDTQRFENTPMRFRRQDLIDEIEEDRYFVVLMAYDFQALRRHRKSRLLWETRFSIRERHHAFNEDLPAMAQYASQFFGQDSHGLVHKEVPMGHVNIGAVKSVGAVPDLPRVPLQSSPQP